MVLQDSHITKGETILCPKTFSLLKWKTTYPYLGMMDIHMKFPATLIIIKHSQTQDYSNLNNI